MLDSALERTFSYRGMLCTPAGRSKEPAKEELEDITDRLAPKQNNLYHPRVFN